MKATEAAKLLANRINQEHYVLHIMQKVYEAGVQEGKKQDSEAEPTPPIPLHECKPMEYDIDGVRHFKCKECGRNMFQLTH
jgi:hypothetical protein